MKIRCRNAVLLCSALFVCPIFELRSEVSLPPIFSEHAVLQKSARVPIWGKASAGEQVKITLGTAAAETVADEGGKWSTFLDLSQSPQGPFELKVQGNNLIQVADVVVGEVWLCSGQSNMEFTLRDIKKEGKEIAESENKFLRQFLVESVDTGVTPENAKGKWTVSNPETSPFFSATGYFFGKALQKELHVPVGLINNARGASACEAWIRLDAFDPELKPGALASIQDKEAYEPSLQNYLKSLSQWEMKYERTDPANSSVPPNGDWKSVKIPGTVPEFGAVWLRRTVIVPKELAGTPLRIILQNVHGKTQIFWNNKKISESSVEACTRNAQRRVSVDDPLVKEGSHVLLLRLFSSTEKPGILTPQSAAGPIPLDGDWEYLMEKSLPDPAGSLAELPKAPERNPQAIHTASYLFNGQIAPIIPYAIKGVVWYQGEFNSSKGYQYRKVFPLLINDWRSQWKQGDFPFYFCQLPNYKPKLPDPSESAWAELREAQSLALALPNTGMATLIDIGDAENLHPTNKRDVGERLARIALARDYGKAVPYTGPVYDSMKVEGNQIVLIFKNTEGGLIAGDLPDAPRNSPSSPLEGFSICGQDRKWVWANARIQGDQVVVSSDQIPSPLAVRYAWSDNPTCNLTNGSGLPCTPFRTDDFPLTSEKRKFPWN